MEALNFLEQHSSLLTVAATFAIAAFTGTLWWSTRRLWEATRREFAATHRPRVVVRMVGAPTHEDEHIYVVLTIANIGETDAIITGYSFDLEYSSGSKLKAGIGRHEPKLPVNASAMRPFRLTSGERHSFKVRSSDRHTDKEVYEDALGVTKLYLGAIVRYEDLNGISRETGVLRVWDDETGSFFPRPEEYQD